MTQQEFDRDIREFDKEKEIESKTIGWIIVALLLSGFANSFYSLIAGGAILASAIGLMLFSLWLNYRHRRRKKILAELYKKLID